MHDPNSAISFSDRVRVPDDILISNLQDESVFLNLESERYFGLDNVGTRISLMFAIFFIPRLTE